MIPHGLAAVLYLRISKDTEALGLGVARQEKEGRGLLERLGAASIEVIIDNDLSASSFATKERPGYRRLIEGVRAGRWQLVAAWDSDRLIRQMRELEEFIDLVGERTIRTYVETVTTGTYDLSTVDGRMTARIKVSVSQAEAERISQRTKAEKRQSAEFGKFSGGRRPFGFMPDGVSHHPIEAEQIRTAAKEIIKGRSLNSLAVEFGVNRRTLHRAMLSPRVRGVRVHQGVEFGDAAWEPILDPETQKAVAAVLSDPARHTNDDKPRSYVLSGILFSDDGRKMWSRPDVRPNGNRLRRYKTMEGSPGISATAEPLERFVTEAMFLRLEEQADALPHVEDATVFEAQAIIEAALSDLAKLRDLRRSGKLDLDDYVFEKEIVEGRIRAAEALVPTAQPYVEPELEELPVAELRRRWTATDDTALTFGQRRALILRHVKRVTVGPTVRGGRGFDTGRVEIDFRS